ncbi:hypothetical protein MSG28_015746 [Choristoneura fumiferana]|uniref:Uncharacterized protein n=1 Tax=Choristoneura fumiferana TaxID=7141 RepID=A0ACC0KCI9_CHOFU|nr:hypothetical protein MSG28_015746 [Choristoneura fumiferana]
MFPDEDITVLYGNPLEIICVAGHGYTSQDLEFFRQGEHINASIVNYTAVRVLIEKPDIGSYVYICTNIKTNKSSSRRVHVDTIPSFVTSFKCISQNLDQMKCSWLRPKTIPLINQSLTYFVNGKTVNPPCHVVSDGNLSSCAWFASHGFPLYRQQLEKYLFKMKSCNSMGCIDEDFTIDHFSIVKPDKPTYLKVLRSGPHDVTLKWRIPNNMVDLLPGGIEHRIEYQIAGIDDPSYFRKVDATYLPPKNRSYVFELTDLLSAHREYEVRIYIKPKKAKEEEFWSDYACKIFNTTSERPQRPPEIAAGAFHQMVYKNHRLVNVFWSQLKKYEEAGANFTYKVVVSQGEKTETLFPETKNYISLVIATLDSLKVSVWSHNAIGTSNSYSYLYIPSLDTQTLLVKYFTMLKHINGTYELSWDRVNDIDNYTLFWCESDTANICVDHINFTTLQPDVIKYYIDLPQVNTYQFSLSANDGSVSSGMTWAECDMARGQIGLFVRGVCEAQPHREV